MTATATDCIKPWEYTGKHLQSRAPYKHHRVKELELELELELEMEMATGITAKVMITETETGMETQVKVMVKIRNTASFNRIVLS